MNNKIPTPATQKAINLIDALLRVGQLEKENQRLRQLIAQGANVLRYEELHHPALVALVAEADQYAESK